MPKFFIEKLASKKDLVEGKMIEIDGDTKKHIINSLRMKKGEKLTLCDGQSIDYKCKIGEIQNNQLKLLIEEIKKSETEPKLKAHLYQAIPKSNKFEQIIQKSVELGVTEITPIITERCIRVPVKDAYNKKTDRWQKISKSAAEQCGRGIIPKINNIIRLDQALKNMYNEKDKVIFYECGGERIDKLISKETEHLSFIVGSEGGFSNGEIEMCLNEGIKTATLGKRILRCETAPLAILSILMHFTES